MVYSFEVLIFRDFFVKIFKDKIQEKCFSFFTLLPPKILWQIAHPSGKSCDRSMKIIQCLNGSK